MNTTTLVLVNNLTVLHQCAIRIFKEIKQPDGSRKIIGYLATWDDMKSCMDNPMTWNDSTVDWKRHLGPENNRKSYKRKGNTPNNKKISTPNT